MDAEVEFGEVREANLPTLRRPDQNGQWAVVACGSPDSEQLPIYIDLDTMLDIQEHASSDTRVELGGVMLGQAGVDDAGQPLVVVADSLRAEHYKATRGSFTFTHETWQQITRQREQRDSSLQMVGWYHTHPGWGVFLSGMDQFICQNFFGKPLDVALVVDPCRGDTGWFQWNKQRQTERCPGFFLYSSRHRVWELKALAEQLSRQPVDDEAPMSRISNSPVARGPVVQIVERTSGLQWIAAILLALQLTLLGWMVWTQLTLQMNASELNQEQRQFLSLPEWEQSQYQRLAAQAKSESYRELAQWLATDRGAEISWVDVLADAELQRKQFESSNRSLATRVEQLERELTAARQTTNSGAAGAAVNSAVNKPSNQTSGEVQISDAAVATDAGVSKTNGWAQWPVIPQWLSYLMLTVGVVAGTSGMGLWLLAYRRGLLGRSWSDDSGNSSLRSAGEEDLEGIS